MTKTTEIIVAASTEQQPEAEPPTKKPNFFPNFNFPNFNFNFNLQQLPFFQPKRKEDKATIIPKQQQQEEGVGEGSVPSKRNLVSFPNSQVVSVPPPLQAQPDAENYHPKTSNPFIIYQVYAIAGFILSKWIWGRWNERNNRGRSPDDNSTEGRHSDDGLDNE